MTYSIEVFIIERRERNSLAADDPSGVHSHDSSDTEDEDLQSEDQSLSQKRQAQQKLKEKRQEQVKGKYS